MEWEKCKECGQKVMVYRRNIRRNMIACLNKLFKTKRPMQTKEISQIANTISDFTKLKDWGLIERVNPDIPDKKGYIWQITPKGIKFITNQISVPKYVFIYNNQVKGYSPETIMARDIYPMATNFNSITEGAMGHSKFQED